MEKITTLTDVIKIIELIKNESSTNEKLNILKIYKDSELLQKVFEYTYNPLKNYYIKKIDFSDIKKNKEDIC